MEIPKETAQLLIDTGLTEVQLKIVFEQMKSFAQDEIDKVIKQLRTN